MRVRAIYMPYSIFDVSDSFGTSLSLVGPGISAFKRWWDLSLAVGKMAFTRTRTHIPPIKWVKLRHQSIPFGRDSISDRTVEPVVVKPDTASKKQFI